MLQNHVPSHFLDGLSIWEAGRIGGQAKLGLESLLRVLFLYVSHRLSLNNLFEQK